jgi:CBS domain containing-hemolysin-like protein
VGEITDEYDVEPTPVQVIGPDESVVDARMGIAALNAQMGLDLPQEDFDTVGGFVFGLFGRQPARGESVRHGDLVFTVETMAGRRVSQIRLQRLAGPQVSECVPGDTS